MYNFISKLDNKITIQPLSSLLFLVFKSNIFGIYPPTLNTSLLFFFSSVFTFFFSSLSSLSILFLQVFYCISSLSLAVLKNIDIFIASLLHFRLFLYHWAQLKQHYHILISIFDF